MSRGVCHFAKVCLLLLRGLIQGLEEVLNLCWP
jgi:hypothetical protein